MKKIKSLLTIGILSFLIILNYISCRKTDRQSEQVAGQAGSSIESKFFTSHRSTNEEENTIVEFIKRVNSKTPFIEQTVKQIGYPRWDKAIKMSKTLTASRATTFGTGKTNTSNSLSDYDTYYIPFVRDSQNYVNASMVIKTSSTDTSIGYLCDWQYRRKTHGQATLDTTAEKHALFFMMMDNRTLGHEEFTITDKRLLSSIPARVGERTLKLKNKSVPESFGRRQSDLANYEVCYDYYVCHMCTGPCDYGYCPGTSTDSYCYLVATICWVSYGSSTGGGWSGYGPSGDPGNVGGGSGGGGNYNGPPVPPVPCQGDLWQAATADKESRVTVFSDCNVSPGWTPVTPTVNDPAFANQFLMPTPGQDGDYDANYWADPNLTMPPQTLPTWDNFKTAYPGHFDPLYKTSQKMYTSVGGQILDLYNSDPAKYNNTCALRVSKALNYSGVIIPAGTDRYLGADGKYYFVSAAALLAWMKKTFGTPSGSNRLTGSQGGTNGQNFPGLVSGKKGIYFMVPNLPGGCLTGNGFCASGHADILENSMCDGGCFFMATGGVSEIFIWELQ